MKSMKKIILSFIMSTHFLFSQTKGFIIEIKNQKDTAYLSDVMVYSAHTKQTTYSDSSGFFVLTNIPVNDTLDFIAMGYVRQKFI
ncbi:MAG: hypothetical protein D6799_07160, partial [Bacteroidetes bacterium]